MRYQSLLSTVLLVFCSHLTRAEELRIPVSRDTWVSAVGEEETANLGGSTRLKLKSIQEMALIDIDPEPLRGRLITQARLHVRLADTERLHRVTVSTVSAVWGEGTSPSYAPGASGASFRFRSNPDVLWSYPGSDLTSVVLGKGNSTWKMADASEPDASGWQTIPVDPQVMAARVAGLSHGFLVFDDTGSEWTYDGSKYEHRLFPNRFIYSREAGSDKAPYFTVELGPEDHTPPTGISEPISTIIEDGLSQAVARFSFQCPQDGGPEPRVAGFLMRVNGQNVPTWAAPAVSPLGQESFGELRDLGLDPGSTANVEVAAVDSAGNQGAWKGFNVSVPELHTGVLPPAKLIPFTINQSHSVKVGETGQVFVVDELDTYTASGESRTGPRSSLYHQSNHLWQASTKQVRIQSSRNEFVAFQVIIAGTNSQLNNAEATLTFADARSGGISVEVGRYIEVPTKDRTWVGDPIVPLGNNASWPSITNRSQRSLHVELYVPHKTPPGEHHGTLRIEAAGSATELAFTLNVWDLTLPDSLQFLPEMNCYDLPSNELDYYRLAHKHRTYLNRVPYFQNGRVAQGCAPTWDGNRLNWTAWDTRFGPLFDGSAFMDLPRRGVPIEGFYLPMHENWPALIEGSYNGNYWADRAFTPEYRAALVEVSRQIAVHVAEKRWNHTIFQGFLNGKNDFKRNGWTRGSSPWLLDEPANFQDFWALRWFGLAMAEGWNTALGQPSEAGVSPRPRLAFRADISRPQWQRNSLNDLLAYLVVNNEGLRKYGRMFLQNPSIHPQPAVIEYGAANPIGSSNVQAVGWSLDAWSRGADGVLPWQTMGTQASWSQADDLALFYPGRNDGDPPVPSVRLKAFRRGQQDVEYLSLNTRTRFNPLPKSVLMLETRKALGLDARREGTGSGGEDAGRLVYDRLDPIALWSLRTRAVQPLTANAVALDRVEATLGSKHWDLPTAAIKELGSPYVPGAKITGQSGFIGPLAPGKVPSP